MNKVTTFVLTAALVLSTGLAFAQDTGMKKECTMGKGMMDGKMMGMMKHGMMMKMMEKNVVATSDGGIVIVAGNKVTKYDKNLNLVKEVELKNDMEGMKKMMADCPMMKGLDKDDDGDEAGEATKPADAVDHASHH